MRAAICLSLAGNGSNVPARPDFSRLIRVLRRLHLYQVLSRRIRSATCGVGRFLIKLAVKRRAADFQTARDFRHLPAVMRNREADDLALQFFQWADFAAIRQHGEHA